MAIRTLQQYLGDIGELTVLRRFLDIGASVNSLAASDFGWDLHLHLPDNAVDPELMPKSWSMSGYTANVQVKNQTGRSAPKVALGTLRGWVSGSVVGTPTFVFRCRSKDRLDYLDPDDLRQLLYRNVRAGKSDSDKVVLAGFSPVPEHSLGRLLLLWCRYPGIMLATDLKPCLADPKLVENVAIGFVSGMAAAFLKTHISGSASSYEPLTDVEHFSDAVTRILFPEDSDEDLRTNMHLQIESSMREYTYHDEWKENIYSQCFASATSEAGARAEVLEAIRGIAALLRDCKSHAPKAKGTRRR